MKTPHQRGMSVKPPKRRKRLDFSEAAKFLTPDQFEALYTTRGITLYYRLFGRDPPENPVRMWAEIGMELAEQQPEFRKGRGRPTGSKTRSLNASPSEDALRKRKRRSKPRPPSPLSPLWAVPLKQDKK